MRRDPNNTDPEDHNNNNNNNNLLMVLALYTVKGAEMGAIGGFCFILLCRMIYSMMGIRPSIDLDMDLIRRSLAITFTGALIGFAQGVNHLFSSNNTTETRPGPRHQI